MVRGKAYLANVQHGTLAGACLVTIAELEADGLAAVTHLWLVPVKLWTLAAFVFAFAFALAFTLALAFSLATSTIVVVVVVAELLIASLLSTLI
jgi:hypothetical protein